MIMPFGVRTFVVRQHFDERRTIALPHERRTEVACPANAERQWP